MLGTRRGPPWGGGEARRRGRASGFAVPSGGAASAASPLTQGRCTRTCSRPEETDRSRGGFSGVDRAFCEASRFHLGTVV